MSAELQDLYQEVILDHNRRPRNFRVIEDGPKAEGFNPLCGDRVTVYLTVDNGMIKDVELSGIRLRDFEGVGVAHDRERQGEDPRGGAGAVRALPADDHGAGGQLPSTVWAS